MVSTLAALRIGSEVGGAADVPPICLRMSNVSVDFTLYQLAARSLKKSLIRGAVGGMIGRRADNGMAVVRSLDGIDLTLREGDRLALLGHNGAGKTTILRVMAGIYQPTGGTIESRGRAIPLFDIGLGIDDEATGLQNITLRGVMMGLSLREIKEKTPEIIEFSGLGDYLHLPVRTYSSGMMLRLLFAIATSVHAEILLLDEWLSAGDAEFERKADQRLESLIESANVLVFASHSMERLRKMCNRAILLNAGQIMVSGPVDEVIDFYTSVGRAKSQVA
jgi:lipopolysaccharide transport system ATP-binding protein